MDYFQTWSAQKKKIGFDLDSVEDHAFITKEGNRLTDLSSVSYQASFGLRPQKVIDRVCQQIQDFSIVSPKSHFEIKQNVAGELIRLIDISGKIFFTVSGAESVENAIKMARDISGRKVIASREKSYHGATLGAVSITGDWRNLGPVTVDDWTLRLPEPGEDQNGKKLRKKIEDYGPEKIAAICLETITGNNGVIIPSHEWYREVQAVCDDYKIKLILDEVICGFYRTGKAFGFQHFDFLRPDFICLAKAISAGVIPFGAVWVADKVASHYDEKILSCGLTNYAHPLGLAATCAVLELVNEKSFKENLDQLIGVFKSSLSEIEQLKCVNEIRQIGMLAAIDYNGSLTWDEFTKAGFYLVAKPKQIIIAPSLTFEPNELKKHLSEVKSFVEKSV